MTGVLWLLDTKISKILTVLASKAVFLAGVSLRGQGGCIFLTVNVLNCGVIVI